MTGIVNILHVPSRNFCRKGGIATHPLDFCEDAKSAKELVESLAGGWNTSKGEVQAYEAPKEFPPTKLAELRESFLVRYAEQPARTFHIPSTRLEPIETIKTVDGKVVKETLQQEITTENPITVTGKEVAAAYIEMYQRGGKWVEPTHLGITCNRRCALAPYVRAIELAQQKKTSTLNWPIELRTIANDVELIQTLCAENDKDVGRAAYGWSERASAVLALTRARKAAGLACNSEVSCTPRSFPRGAKQLFFKLWQLDDTFKRDYLTKIALGTQSTKGIVYSSTTKKLDLVRLISESHTAADYDSYMANPALFGSKPDKRMSLPEMQNTANNNSLFFARDVTAALLANDMTLLNGYAENVGYWDLCHALAERGCTAKTENELVGFLTPKT